MSTLRRDWPDIGYSAVATLGDIGQSIQTPHYVRYRVYSIEGVQEDGSLLWHKAGSSTWPDPIASVTEAEIYLHGDVRWDGCSDWHFDEQDRCMLHGCSREDLVALGEVMARCWDWTRELIHFEG